LEELMAKAYKDYTVGDMRRLRLSFLVNGKSHEDADENRARFAHLLAVSGGAGIPIDGMTMGMFLSPDSVTTMLPPSGINRVIFEIVRPQYEAKATEGGYGIELVKTDLKDISAGMFKNTGGRRNRIVRQIDSKLNDISSYQRYLSEAMVRLREYRQELAAIDLMTASGISESRALEQMQAILSNPFWAYLGLVSSSDGGVLWFNTTKAIVLRYNNPATGVNAVANLGAFIVKLDMANCKVNVFTFRGNVRPDGNSFIHPHMRDANVCYGDMQEAVSSAWGIGDIAKVMEITHAVLTAYNHDSTYRDLVEFDDTQSEVTRVEPTYPGSMPPGFRVNIVDPTGLVGVSDPIPSDFEEEVIEEEEEYEEEYEEDEGIPLADRIPDGWDINDRLEHMNENTNR